MEWWLFENVITQFGKLSTTADEFRIRQFLKNILRDFLFCMSKLKFMKH